MTRNPMRPSSPDLDTLLQHQEWVRTLARHLVADASLAEDVAQQTMVEAIERAPKDLRAPRGWLLRVARHAARGLMRQERRRARREQAVAAAQGRAATLDAAAADPAVTVQRAQAHKRVVDAVLGLPEPYRTVVLMRYFDDLDATEIARRLGRPLATVRTQVQRGIERLRAQLEAEFGGDGAAWRAALLPLCGVPEAAAEAAGAAVGGLGLTKILLLAALALVAAWPVWVWIDGSIPPSPPSAPATVDTMARAAGGRGDGATGAPSATAERESIAAAPAIAPPPPPSGLRGRVCTLDGAFAAGVVVAWQDPKAPKLHGRVLVHGNTHVDLDQPGLREVFALPDGVLSFAAGYAPHDDVVVALITGAPVPRPRATTGPDGRFVLDVPGRLDELVVEGGDHMIYGHGRSPSGDERILVVGPAVLVEGRVRDADAQPIEDAFVHTGYQLDSMPGLGATLRDATGYRSWNATTDADGRFHLGLVPLVPSLRVTVQKRGFDAVSLRTSEIHGPIECTLALEAPRELPFVSGVVRHADGTPAVDVRIEFGPDRARTDAAGNFRLQCTRRNEDKVLTAWLPGFQPCVREGIGELLQQDAEAATRLELRLGGPALTITGRVLDAAGEGLAGWRVVAVGSTFVGNTDQLLEELVAGECDAATDAEGRFSLGGLMARDYIVRAVDPATLLVLESGAIAAGTGGIELCMGERPFHGRLTGVVVDRFGSAVVDATVHLRAPLLTGPVFSKSLTRKDRVRADAAGRFVLDRVPRHGVELVVGGDGITARHVVIDDGVSDLRVEVVRRVRFRLRRLGGVAAECFRVLDEQDQELWVTAVRPGLQFTHRRVRIDASTSVYEVDDRAVRIVFRAGDEVVMTQPITLRAGDVAEIAY
jgi:RNA polymerase sigma factor (sigma-70 family)